MNKLDQEEREILEALESGNVNRSTNAAETPRHKEDAKAMFQKDARINIRLPSKDLRGLQKRALSEGIPYQTLVASVLRKNVEGRLRENGSQQLHSYEKNKATFIPRYAFFPGDAGRNAINQIAVT